MKNAAGGRLSENLIREWQNDRFSTELWEVMGEVEAGNPGGTPSLLKVAADGSALGMALLGEAYLFGEFGLDKSASEAEKWLIRAGDYGSIEGRWWLAELYRGKGRKEEARSLYKQLAENDYAPAYFALGCEKKEAGDLEGAWEHFNKGAKLGHLHCKDWVHHIDMRRTKSLRQAMRHYFLGLFSKTRISIMKRLYPNSDLLKR